MDKKLTLSVDPEVVAKAKAYAKSRNMSLSKLIESYLRSITAVDEKEDEITPLVKSLSGVISGFEDSPNDDSYSEYIDKKYQ